MPATLEGGTGADVDTPLLEPPGWPVGLEVELGQAVSARVVPLKIHANYK